MPGYPWRRQVRRDPLDVLLLAQHVTGKDGMLKIGREDSLQHRAVVLVRQPFVLHGGDGTNLRGKWKRQEESGEKTQIVSSFFFSEAMRPLLLCSDGSDSAYRMASSIVLRAASLSPFAA